LHEGFEFQLEKLLLQLDLSKYELIEELEVICEQRFMASAYIYIAIERQKK
jgi:hypothetical protein